MKHKEKILRWVLFIVLFWNCAMALTSSLDFYLKVLLALSSLSPLLIFFDINRIQDSAADFSRQICGQIAPQIPGFKATASSGFIRLFRHFIY